MSIFASIPSDRRYSQKALVLWILVSVIYVAGSVRMIVHHNDLGWFLLPVWAFVMVVWLSRALKGRVKG
jgi:hypothetical protein